MAYSYSKKLRLCKRKCPTTLLTWPTTVLITLTGCSLCWQVLVCILKLLNLCQIIQN